MKMMTPLVVSLLLSMMIAHAEGAMSTGVLQKVTCVAGGVPFTMRLEKCFLGGALLMMFKTRTIQRR